MFIITLASPVTQSKFLVSHSLAPFEWTHLASSFVRSLFAHSWLEMFHIVDGVCCSMHHPPLPSLSLVTLHDSTSLVKHLELLIMSLHHIYTYCSCRCMTRIVAIYIYAYYPKEKQDWSKAWREGSDSRYMMRPLDTDGHRWIGQLCELCVTCGATQCSHTHTPTTTQALPCRVLIGHKNPGDAWPGYLLTCRWCIVLRQLYGHEWLWKKRYISVMKGATVALH